MSPHGAGTACSKTPPHTEHSKLGSGGETNRWVDIPVVMVAVNKMIFKVSKKFNIKRGLVHEPARRRHGLLQYPAAHAHRAQQVGVGRGDEPLGGYPHGDGGCKQNYF